MSGTSSSDLHVSSVRMEDSGEYSCHSDLAIAASVQVYVTSGQPRGLLPILNSVKLILLRTRPNRSTRSEDYTQMTTLVNQNEHKDSI